jgi:hypothetical protein
LVHLKVTAAAMHAFSCAPTLSRQTCNLLLLLLLLLFSCVHSPYTDPYDGSTKQGPELTLVPAVGKPGKVVIQNIYAGKVSRNTGPLDYSLLFPLVLQSSLAQLVGTLGLASRLAGVVGRS